MADYNITLTDISPTQVAAAQHMMAETNAVRKVNGDPEFADVKEFIAHQVKEGILPDWERVYEQETVKQTDLKRRFMEADQTVKDQIIALLPE